MSSTALRDRESVVNPRCSFMATTAGPRTYKVTRGLLALTAAPCTAHLPVSAFRGSLLLQLLPPTPHRLEYFHFETEPGGT